MYRCKILILIVDSFDLGANRRGNSIHRVSQCVCPFVGIGSPPPQVSVASPRTQGEGRHNRLRYGVWGPNTNKGTETLVLCVYHNPSTG